MPRGVYERKPRSKILSDRLRDLADEIEKDLQHVDEAKEILRRLGALGKFNLPLDDDQEEDNRQR